MKYSGTHYATIDKLLYSKKSLVTRENLITIENFIQVW